MWKRFIGLTVAVVFSSSCATGSPYEDVTDETTAIQAWSKVYMNRQCFAPDDYGTSVYPTDLAMDDDYDCSRTMLLDVTSEQDENGDTLWCFDHVWQSSWKFDDDPGFGIGTPRRSTWCYYFTRNADTGEVDFASGGIQRAAYQDLAEWPGGGGEAAPATAPESNSGCDPNYTGTCVPNVEYDLDCVDIGMQVYVTGADVHGFDRDGDGLGCESYG